MTATWAQVENAIHGWIVAATGIAAGRVRWADIEAGRPATPGTWITLSVVAEGGQGSPWVDVEDNVIDPAPLADIAFVARSQNAGVLSIQVFDAPATGNTSGVALLRKLRPALRLPSVSLLVDGIVGFGAFEPAQNVQAPANAQFFESRAAMACSFYTAAELRETAAGVEEGTWIETVEITGELE